jgi:hypothetical protein
MEAHSVHGSRVGPNGPTFVLGGGRKRASIASAEYHARVRHEIRETGRAPWLRSAIVGLFVAVVVVASWSIVMREPPPPADAPRALEVRSAFERAHERVYDVYRLEPDRDAVYDHLQMSFVGDALTREYVEHYTTLVRMQRDRTAIRVLTVDYDDVRAEPLEAGRWRVDADWSVGGTVRHQGHTHTRVNRYRAVFELVDAGSGWRIVDSRMSDLSRVRTVFTGASPFAGDEEASRGGFIDLKDLLDSGFELPEDADGDGTPDDPDADEPSPGGSNP